MHCEQLRLPLCTIRMRAYGGSFACIQLSAAAAGCVKAGCGNQLTRALTDSTRST
jgi:hypothetical protein